MPIPDPEPGMIVRNGYLWRNEDAAGRDQDKTRPACIVAAEISRIAMVVSANHAVAIRQSGTNRLQPVRGLRRVRADPVLPGSAQNGRRLLSCAWRQVEFLNPAWKFAMIPRAGKTWHPLYGFLANG